MANQGGRVYYWDDYTNDDDRRAMWADPNVKPLWEKRLDATGKVPFMMERVGKKMVPYLTSEEMHAVASIIESRHFSGTRLAGLAGSEGDLAAAIARVESAWQPLAYRFENKLGEASTGLMQVLQSTAEWLAREMGYPAYAADVASSMLCRPFAGVYYGMAYLAWLTTYKGIARSEEFVVHAYHGGPGGWEKESAARHWSKYLQAKEELLRMLHDSSAPSLPSTPAPSLPPPVLPPTPLRPTLEAPRLQSSHALIAHPPHTHAPVVAPAPISHPNSCPFPQQTPFPHEPPFPQQPPFPSAAQASFPSPLQSIFPSSSSEHSGHFSLSVKWGFKSGRE
ncbi:unnamed protein product [Closterium sp. Naga37s-1]|nr:unnamed protein product [Closterium sp. Naga37s-1]